MPVGGGRLQGASDEAAGRAGDGPEEGAGQPRRPLREAAGLGRSISNLLLLLEEMEVALKNYASSGTETNLIKMVEKMRFFPS